jgi:UDP-N-acetylmuramyl pentapeptide phosphotransferase/UDP-N-acetylglucosamine-1-phosphate transferase
LHGHISFDHDKKGVQKFHSFDTPRIGGLPIFIGIAAVGTGQARALTLVASGAPAAFIRICQLFLRHSWSRRTSSVCYFSAAGTSRREA